MDDGTNIPVKYFSDYLMNVGRQLLVTFVFN